uniref:NADH-ubiquinone oxidoreductase chain 2 n=1 Tax=Rieppeleon brevicaudatus TaxID=338556 RepID=Q8SHB2_RIEBR|nr:NADH dehydrogenase subunit 2 [Rieppeleon brevicaudatus]
MNLPTKLVTTTGLISGTLIVISGNHWMMTWIGLELNMLAALTIIMKPKHPRTAEAAIKYFLTQAIASAMILYASTINATQTGQWDMSAMTNKYACTMLLLALTIKLGTIPMHFWLPEVMQGTATTTALIIASWQKIAPISIMLMTCNHLPQNMMVAMGLLSIIIGGLGGINQTQLRKLMAFSSISNLGWTLTIFSISPFMATVNIMIYMITLSPSFMIMKKTSLKTLQNLTTAWTSSPLANTLLMLLLLSLSGLPPLTGFTPKIMILNELTTQNLTPLAATMTLASLISLMFYIRTTYITAMVTPPMTPASTTKWRTPPAHKKLTSAAIPPSLIILPLMPLLLAMT